MMCSGLSPKVASAVWRLQEGQEESERPVLRRPGLQVGCGQTMDICPHSLGERRA